MSSRARVLALVAALVVAGVVMGNQSALAARPRCAVLSARAELSCARLELRHAERALARPRMDRALLVARHHSAGYWRWRERVDRRWIRSAQSRLLLEASSPAAVPAIICHVFGPTDCLEAKGIAWRESRDEISAWNSSDHGGLFQLGTGERAKYATIGYSSAYEQVVAAHNLFLARGWEPWTCCEG